MRPIKGAINPYAICRLSMQFADWCFQPKETTVRGRVRVLKWKGSLKRGGGCCEAREGEEEGSGEEVRLGGGLTGGKGKGMTGTSGGGVGQGGGWCDRGGNRVRGKEDRKGGGGRGKA